MTSIYYDASVLVTATL